MFRSRPSTLKPVISLGPLLGLIGKKVSWTKNFFGKNGAKVTTKEGYKLCEEKIEMQNNNSAKITS